MTQRTALLISILLTTFVVVVMAGVAWRVTQTSADVTPPEVVTAEPASPAPDAQLVAVENGTALIEEQVAQREAAYRERIQEANERLQRANEQLQQAYQPQQTLTNQLEQAYQPQRLTKDRTTARPSQQLRDQH